MKKVIVTCLFFLFFQSVFSQADIFEVARKGTVQEMNSLLKENPNLVNSISDEGYSLLILATYRGNNEVAKFLVEKGADVNGTSNYGTPLMAAVVKGNLEMINLLLEHKADTSIADQSGNTALIYAVLFKKYEIVGLLVKANADINTKDIRGKSAIDYATMTNDDKLLQLLKK